MNNLSVLPPVKIHAPSWQIQAMAELERRRRRQARQGLDQGRTAPDVAAWIATLTIEDPHGADVSIIPFDLWPAQRETLSVLCDSAQVIVLIECN